MRPLWVCALLCWLTLPALGQFSGPEDGGLSFTLSTIAVDAPLFGVNARYTYSLFLRQRYASGEQFSLFGTGGFPSSRPFLTLELSGLRFMEGVATAEAGDVSIQSLKPVRYRGPSGGAGSLPILGAGADWTKGSRQLQLFTGVSRYAIGLPDQTELDRPWVTDLAYLERFGRTHLGGQFTLIVDPVYLGSDRNRSIDAVTSGRYIRELRPYVHAFTEGALSLNGSGSIRAGFSGDYRNGEVSTSVYAFGDDMPFLYPLFRPGESGVEANGSYRFSEFGSVSGNVNYFQDDPIQRGSSFSASGQLGYSFGYDRPYLTVSASHNELVYENFERESIARFGDRYAIGLSRSSVVHHYSLRLEHAEDDVVSRTQLYGGYGRAIGQSGALDTYLVLQQSDDDERGAVGEVTVQNPLRHNLSYILGLGGSYRDVDTRRAEGFVTAGLSWQSPYTGLIARVDAILPFDVGLPRTNRVSRTIRAQAGIRYDWEHVSELRRLLAPILYRNEFGGVEGRVMANGEAVSGAVILIGGNPMATSGGDGRFSVSRIPIGQVRVAIDPFSVDPSLVMPQPLTIGVAPRQTTTVEIELIRAVALFGSLVRCDGDALRGVPNATIALIGDQGVYELQTTADGGFAASDVSPGFYSVIIDPATVGDVPSNQIPAVELDLTQDLLGYVIRIGCPGQE